MQQQGYDLGKPAAREFARSANPDAAVLAFDRFLTGLHGGGRLFSLLRQNPDLIALIALVLGTARVWPIALRSFRRSWMPS